MPLVPRERPVEYESFRCPAAGHSGVPAVSRRGRSRSVGGVLNVPFVSRLEQRAARRRKVHHPAADYPGPVTARARPAWLASEPPIKRAGRASLRTDQLRFCFECRPTHSRVAKRASDPFADGQAFTPRKEHSSRSRRSSITQVIGRVGPGGWVEHEGTPAQPHRLTAA